MKTSNKKITFSASVLSLMGLTLAFGLSLSLVGNHSDNHASMQLNDTVSTNDNMGGQNITQSNLGFNIRSNPTNGFNGLTTSDGKYTYALITTTGVTADRVGGSNSGIACVDNITGNVISTWYLPSDDVFNLNYTTNIVFGQKLNSTGQTVFDETKLFVLCGISNLAAAINQVYTSYDKTTHTLNTNISNGPTIKIFSLTVTNPSVITNTYEQNKCFEFAYPSDGTNGYSGFNVNGVPYDMQDATGSEANNNSLYYASGVDFSQINRKGPIWQNGISFASIQDTTITAFGSYLTYLTYGQNFAYHLGKQYEGGVQTTYVGHDEFIMTTSFVNVDQNIGGLYSASVTNGEAEDTEVDGIYSKATEQADWPIPFGYQWLLADIANVNSNQASGIQYSYIDANGVKQAVNWGDDLALGRPIIDFLNDEIFPLEVDPDSVHSEEWQNGNLFASLQVSGRFGANWGTTTGYIIFIPQVVTPVLPIKFTVANVSEYRYYYVAEITLRSYDDASATVNLNASTCIFTNLTIADQFSNNDDVHYLIGIAWAKDKTVFNNDSNMNVNPFATLLTNTYTSMFCYDWESLSNDDQGNALIQPLQAQLDGLRYGFLKDHYLQSSTSQVTLKNSFANWNLVFLGGPNGQQADYLDTSFTIDPTFGEGSNQNSIVWQLCSKNDSANAVALGRRLTYLRHKIAFVTYIYNGFVYFTAGTSLEWQNGLSIWEVKNVTGLNSIKHNYALGIESSNVVGTTYLSLDINGTPMWDNFDEVVYAIKQTTQPYGNSHDCTLEFITSHGIYSIGGQNKNPFSGTVNDFLTAVSTFQKGSQSVYTSRNPLLLNTIQFAEFAKPDALMLNPEIMVVGNNFLCVLNDTPLLFSVQESNDYLVSGIVKYPPDSLADIPAVKPLLNVKDSAIKLENSQINAWLDTLGNSKNLAYIKSIGIDQFANDLGINNGSSLPKNCVVSSDFDQNKFGSIFQPVNEDNTIVNFEIPVVYGDSKIVYYAPIMSTDSAFGYASYSTISNLNLTITKMQTTVIVIPTVVTILIILLVCVGIPLLKQHKIKSLIVKINQKHKHPTGRINHPLKVQKKNAGFFHRIFHHHDRVGEVISPNTNSTLPTQMINNGSNRPQGVVNLINNNYYGYPNMRNNSMYANGNVSTRTINVYRGTVRPLTPYMNNGKQNVPVLMNQVFNRNNNMNPWQRNPRMVNATNNQFWPTPQRQSLLLPANRSMNNNINLRGNRYPSFPNGWSPNATVLINRTPNNQASMNGFPPNRMNQFPSQNYNGRPGQQMNNFVNNQNYNRNRWPGR